MTIEIKTATLEPVRNTYEHTRRRFGDKPASRYQEASYDIAPENNFHASAMKGEADGFHVRHDRRQRSRCVRRPSV